MYQQLVDSLTRDEWMLLQGLAWIYAGVNEPISPLSDDFAMEYGIQDAKTAQQNLISKGIIDDHYEIQDNQFLLWIWQKAFGGIGLPPEPARMYRPCKRLDDSVLGA